MKKRYILLSLMLVLAMLLAACGSTDTGTDAGDDADAGDSSDADAGDEDADADAGEEMGGIEDDLGVIEIPAGESIKVAINVVTSGAGVDVLGLDELRGAQIAIADYGDILGFTVEDIAEDTLCSAEGGQSGATKTIANSSIVGVVGHTCSSSCTPAAGIYDQAGFTMISPSCTAPALTHPDTHVASFLRTAHNDSGQGAVAAEFAYNDLGARTVATIHDGSPYADQLQAVFVARFVELGGEVLAQEAINVGDTDMRPVLTTIAALEPDLLYYPIFPAEGGFITQQRFDVGLEDTLMMGADGLVSTTFLEAAGDAAEGVYVTGPSFSTSDSYDAFLATYVDLFGEEPPAPFHAHSYDAMTMLLAAIEKVGVVDGDGTLWIGRQALRDAIYATSGLNGLIGSITCQDNGDCGFSEDVGVQVVTDGDFAPVE